MASVNMLSLAPYKKKYIIASLHCIYIANKISYYQSGNQLTNLDLIIIGGYHIITGLPAQLVQSIRVEI